RKFGLRITINAAVFRQPLRRLRRAILTSGVVLIHDNSRLQWCYNPAAFGAV
ncbi:hypothetical protein AVEN_240199-1, partial [Araneus ventricosus]